MCALRAARPSLTHVFASPSSSLEVYFTNRDLGVVLPMPLKFPVPGFGMESEDNLLIVPAARDDFRRDRRIREVGSAYRGVFPFRNQEYFVKRKRLARLTAYLLDFQLVPGFDLVLFSAGHDYGKIIHAF